MVDAKIELVLYVMAREWMRKLCAHTGCKVTDMDPAAHDKDCLFSQTMGGLTPGDISSS